MGKRRTTTARHREIVSKSNELRRRCGVAGGAPTSADVQSEPKSQVATFSRLYESLDGRLCLFEDGNGHLSAVNTARFA